MGVLNKKKKEMFARELASIKDLERSEQGASEDVGLSDAVEVSEPIVNSFNSLFDSFPPSVLAFFLDISQFSRPPLG